MTAANAGAFRIARNALVDILCRRIRPAPAPHRSRILTGQGRVAEPESSHPTCLGWRHTGLGVLLRLQCQMEVQFPLDLGVGPRTPEPGKEPNKATQELVGVCHG